MCIEVEVPVYRDIHGNPICNSRGELLDPPATKTVLVPTVERPRGLMAQAGVSPSGTVHRNVTIPDPQVSLDYLRRRQGRATVSIDLNKLEAMKSEANALREEHIKNEAEIARLRSRSKEINGRLESLYVEIQRAVLGDPEDTRDHPAPARPAEPEGKAAGKGAKPGAV